MNTQPLYVYLLLALLSCPSCVFKSLKEARNEVNTLQREKVKSDSLSIVQQKKYDTDTRRLKGQVDSLVAEIQTYKGMLPNDLIAARDSLQRELQNTQEKYADLTVRASRLSDTLRDYKSALHAIYGLPGNQTVTVSQKQHTYDCYVVDCKQSNLQFYWKDQQGKPIQSLSNLATITDKNSKTLVFATNGGMYKNDRSPQGLFIQNGKVLIPIDRRQEEYGNFYMQPNGVFMIDTNNVASIVPTDQFEDETAKRVKFATQSGPMVLINGEINTKFKIDSENKNIRSGVGIMDSTKLVFVISNQQVSFYDFASVFKDIFKCSNALYLDGAISEMYLPEAGRLQKGGSFGPIIGVIK